MVCDCGSSNVNWSNKIKEADSRARTEMGVELGELEDIVVSVQTNSNNDLGPAIIVGEDDGFLDIKVLHMESGIVRPAVVSKSQIQSVVILGAKSSDDEDDEVESEGDFISESNSNHSKENVVVEDITLNGMYL